MKFNMLSTAQLFSEITSHLRSNIDSLAARHSATIALRPFESHGIQVSVRRLAPNNYKIYFPLGLLDRFILLSSLFRFSTKIDPVDHVQSYTDRRQIEFHIPTRLKLVFDPNEAFCQETAQSLAMEYCNHPADFTLIQSVFDFVNFLLHHELGHVSLGHLEYFEYCRSNDSEMTSDTLGYSEFDFRQGYEVAADQFAAMYFAPSVIAKTQLFKKHGLPPSAALSESIITIALLVSLFDIRSRSLDIASAEFHPHPILRYSIINFAIAEALEADGQKDLSDEYWRLTRKWADSVSARIHGIYLSEMLREQRSVDLPEGTVPICPLRFDKNPINESIFWDYLTRTAERGRRMDMRINLHKEFNFFGLAGLREEFNKDLLTRWKHVKDRARSTSIVRDKVSAGARFTSFYGPIRGCEE